MESGRRTFDAFTSADVNTKRPYMASAWRASCQAGFVSFGGLVAAVVITAVMHRDSPGLMAGVLAVPLSIFLAVAAYEWWAGRRLNTRLSRLNLIVVAVGLVLWVTYERAPGGLPADPTSVQLCEYVGYRLNHACLVKAHAARLHADIAWWSTGALIVLFGLLARRSRTAAWCTPAIAIAGSALALQFLESFTQAMTAVG